MAGILDLRSQRQSDLVGASGLSYDEKNLDKADVQPQVRAPAVAAGQE
jgi:hypothetical protein